VNSCIFFSLLWFQVFKEVYPGVLRQLGKTKSGGLRTSSNNNYNKGYYCTVSVCHGCAVMFLFLGVVVHDDDGTRVIYVCFVCLFVVLCSNFRKMPGGAVSYDGGLWAGRIRRTMECVECLLACYGNRCGCPSVNMVR